MNTKVDSSEYENIINLYKSGMKQSDIGKIYGVANNTISRILTKCGIYANRKIPYEEYDLVFQMYRNGISATEIAKKYNVANNLIYYILKKHGVEIRDQSEANRKYNVNINYFDKIDTPNKAYILGLFAADGYVTLNPHSFGIGLQEKDVDILEKIKHEMGSTHPLYFVKLDDKKFEIKGKPVNKQNRYILKISNKHMCDKLIEHGIIPNKTFKLSFPEWMDRDLIRHYIRGYLDGDGSISRTKNKLGIGFYGDGSFLLGIKEYLENELNIEMKVGDHGSIKVLYVYKKDFCIKILDHIYKNADLYLDRKYNTYKELYH